LILCTEFPKQKEPTNISEKIIMDSDLIQCYDNDWFIYAVKGLSEERNVSTLQSLMDQTNFINNITYYTNYAQDIHDKTKEGYIEQLEYLKTIFK
jgi:hypothetical protein